MPYFTDTEVKRIELAAEGYWVDVKTNLKYGDIKHFINMTKDGVVDTVTSLDKFMKAAIADWNLDDSDGNKAPVDQEHIDQLDQKDAIAIVNAAGAAATGAPEDNTDFLSGSDPSSAPEQSETPPANS